MNKPALIFLKFKIILFITMCMLLSSVTAHAALSELAVSQLYVSIFNRASEGEGNQYWRTLELDMATTADVMLETDAAKQYFGTSLNSNQAFIEHIYLNTLNKTPSDDPDGIAHWVGLLDSGMSRGQVVSSLVSVINDYAPDGAYYNPDDVVTVAAYNQFLNRVLVSSYMAHTVQNTPADWATSTSFSVGLIVTDASETILSAMDKIDAIAAGKEEPWVDTVQEAQPSESGSLLPNQWLHRKIDVPAGTTQLQADLTVSNGLVELLLKHGQQPDEVMYHANGEDCYDYADPDSDGQCVIDSPTPGTWYIALWAESDADFTLRTKLISTGDEDDDPTNPVEYQPGIPAPTTTVPTSTSHSAPAGSPANVVLDDGSLVEIPALVEGFDARLERFSLAADGSVQNVLNTLADTTDLTPTGAVRQLRIDGSGDGSSLRATITIPAAELGTINPASLNVLRIGDVYIDGQLTEDTRLLSATLDNQGNLSFVDPLLREGLKAPSPPLLSAALQNAAGGASGSWTAQAQYQVVSFQGSLNWNRPPYLIRMKPLPGDGAQGYRRPVTSAERTELAKQPICNVVLLVHGHNEDEKGGSSVATSQRAPWLFNYKRLVWEQFYQEITRTQVTADGNEEPIYPYECTAFYEFIYPTYRPIFSEVVDAGGTSHETLGDALGVMMQQELVNDPQLKAMIQNDMPFNAMIVAHSQGGLVARAGLRQMPQEFKDRTVRLVTWGTPHRGAPLYTLRYSFEAGHAMEINGVPLPLQEITNNWFWGPRYREALDGHLAIDAPGIRDLRWESNLRSMLNMDSLFPTLTQQAETDLKIPIYSQNLSVFNADTSFEQIAGGYTFIVGETSKRVDLSFDDVFQAYYFITGSTSIEQGATLNSLLVHDAAEKVNDGAVPLISQQARGLSFPHQTKILNLGDIDHEEFYGAEPAQRTTQALERGRLTTRTTMTELGFEDSGSRCPTIEDVEVTPENDEIRISGRLVYPVQEVNNVGNDQPGPWMERIEARKRNQEGALVTGMDFTIEDDGTFEWSGAPDLLPEEAILLVAVLKDGSEVVGEVDQITVTIMPPRIIIYELQGGATEATDTFEANARPDGLYRYEWNFGDGSAVVVDTPAAGQPSRVSHTFTNLKDDDEFRPSVKIFGAEGVQVARDEIFINVVVEEEEETVTKNIDISIGPGSNDEEPKIYGGIRIVPLHITDAGDVTFDHTVHEGDRQFKWVSHIWGTGTWKDGRLILNGTHTTELDNTTPGDSLTRLESYGPCLDSISSLFTFKIDTRGYWDEPNPITSGTIRVKNYPYEWLDGDHGMTCHVEKDLIIKDNNNLKPYIRVNDLGQLSR